MKSSIKRIVAQSNGLAYIDSKGQVRYSEAKGNEKEVKKLKKIIKQENEMQ